MLADPVWRVRLDAVFFSHTVRFASWLSLSDEGRYIDAQSRHIPLFVVALLESRPLTLAPAIPGRRLSPISGLPSIFCILLVAICDICTSERGTYRRGGG